MLEDPRTAHMLKGNDGFLQSASAACDFIFIQSSHSRPNFNSCCRCLSSLLRLIHLCGECSAVISTRFRCMQGLRGPVESHSFLTFVVVAVAHWSVRLVPPSAAAAAVVVHVAVETPRPPATPAAATAAAATAAAAAPVNLERVCPSGGRMRLSWDVKPFGQFHLVAFQYWRALSEASPLFPLLVKSQNQKRLTLKPMSAHAFPFLSASLHLVCQMCL